MHKLSPGDKRQLVQQARRYGLSLMPPEHRESPEGGCLYFALGFVRASTEWLGPGFTLQAGSASFKIVPDDKDDGVSPNYFSYQFDPVRAVVPYALGAMPEMHVWCGNVRTRELVDVTVGFQKDQCHRLLGAGTWRTPDPQPFVWDHTFNLERQTDVLYVPDVTAMQVAAEYAHRLLKGDGR